VLPLLGLALCALAYGVSRPGVVEFVQGPFWFLAKVFVFLFLYIWVRGTLPRFRYDQLMAVGWKLLLPVSMANVVLTSFHRGGQAMTAELVIFFLLAGVAVASALNLILQRHPIHSALSLVVVMMALAGLYLLQGAEFIAAVQIIVYAGAIMVLFIFVIMLLNAGEEERTNLSRMARWVGLPLGIFLLLQLVYWIGRAPEAPPTVAASPAQTRKLAMMLFQEFVFPFELTSILILIAILGALVLAKKES